MIFILWKIHIYRTCKGGWQAIDILTTVFRSYQDSGKVIMKGFEQWNPIYGRKDFQLEQELTLDNKHSRRGPKSLSYSTWDKCESVMHTNWLKKIGMHDFSTFRAWKIYSITSWNFLLGKLNKKAIHVQSNFDSSKCLGLSTFFRTIRISNLPSRLFPYCRKNPSVQNNHVFKENVWNYCVWSIIYLFYEAWKRMKTITVTKII